MKNKAVPPTYFSVLLVLLVISHFIFPIKRVIYAPYTYSGIVLVIFGTAINIWADALFKKGKTTVKPHEKPTLLETSGPFRISRHPMYFGMATILLGAAIFLGSLITFLFPAIFIILMELLFLPVEEKNLEKAFGKKYINYRKNVRRWI